MKTLKVLAYTFLALHFIACQGKKLQVYKGDSRPRGAHGAPAAVEAVFAQAKSATVIQATWKESTLAAGYRVEMRLGGDYWSVAALHVEDLDVDISSLRPNTPYDFRVIAYNSEGDSPPSNIATATTLAGGGGSAGGGLLPAVTWVGPGVVLQNNDTAVATWNPVSVPVTIDPPIGYAIWARVRNVTPYYLVATVSAGILQFTYLGVPAEVTLDFQIAAYNRAGDGGLSEQRTVTTPPPAAGGGGGGGNNGGGGGAQVVRFEDNQYGRIGDSAAPKGVIALACDAVVKPLWTKDPLGPVFAYFSRLQEVSLSSGATPLSGVDIKNLVNSTTGSALAGGTWTFLNKPATAKNLIRRFLYERYLDRTARGLVITDAELTAWKNVLAGAQTWQYMKAKFIASSEFYSVAGGTPAGWADRLFVKLLGRAASAAERTALANACLAGSNPCNEARRYALALERIKEMTYRYHFDYETDAIYRYLLGRAATGTELDAMANGAIVKNEHYQAFKVVAISPDFRNKFKNQWVAFRDQTGGICGQ